MGRTACTEPQCLYSRAIPLLPLWAVRSVQSLSACTVQLYLYSPYGPYGLYRASVPVQGCTLPFTRLDQPLCTHRQLLQVRKQLQFWPNVFTTWNEGKAVPLEAWSGPEGSRKLRFPDFVTTAQDGGRLSALCSGPLYSQKMLLVLISVRGWIDPRATVRSEEFYVNEKSTDTNWDRTNDLPICSTAP